MPPAGLGPRARATVARRASRSGHHRSSPPEHDPERDGRALWEKLVLDGFQAGLAWITILRKRETMRAAFAGFEPAAVARFDDADVSRLLADPGIIRSRAKIDAAMARIAEGTYGYCEETGEPISLRRLEARPIATLSIEAQERHERNERVHRDD